jgi:hypothetical protein
VASILKGWTTEANILEGSRTNEVELIEIIADTKNTMLKFTENNQIIGCVLLVERSRIVFRNADSFPELQNSGLGKNYCRQKFVHAQALGCPKL